MKKDDAAKVLEALQTANVFVREEGHEWLPAKQVAQAIDIMRREVEPVSDAEIDDADLAEWLAENGHLPGVDFGSFRMGYRLAEVRALLERK